MHSPPSHGRDNSHRPVDPTSVTTFPQRRLTREPTATNIKFFGNELGRTLGPLSSGGETHAISQIGVRDPLWTTQCRGVPETYLMRWVV